MSVYRVVEPFAADVNGVPRVYRAGDLVKSGDPALKGREKLFVEVEEFASRGANVEQATAAPGERRSVMPKKAPGKAVTKEPTDG